MKKIIARGATLFLTMMIVFTLILSCYAEADTGKEWTIENNLEGVITIDTDLEECTVTITNNSRTTIKHVYLAITVENHTEETDSMELEGLTSKKINLKDYFTQNFLDDREVKITLVQLEIIWPILFLGVVVFIGSMVLIWFDYKKEDGLTLKEALLMSIMPIVGGSFFVVLSFCEFF